MGQTNATQMRRDESWILLNQRGMEDPVLTECLKQFSQEHAIVLKPMTEAGAGLRLAREALAAGVGRVIAGGGDGTVHEVANALCSGAQEHGVNTTLGILPYGTANDLAAACGIPDDNPEEALRIALTTPARPIDLAQAGDAVFINAMTCGKGAEATANAPSELKEFLGPIAYLLSGISEIAAISPFEVHIAAPDFSWEGEVWGFAVANGPMAGGGFQLAPDASLDDGLLDLAMLPAASLFDLTAQAAALMQGKQNTEDNQIIRRRLPWLEVEVKGDVQINLDGEPYEERKMKIQALHRCISAHVPRTSLGRE